MPSPEEISAAQAAKIAEFKAFSAKVQAELEKLGEAYTVETTEVPGNATYTSIFAFSIIKFPALVPYWNGWGLKYYHIQAGWTPKRVATAALRQALWMLKNFPDEVLKPPVEEQA